MSATTPSEEPDRTEIHLTRRRHRIQHSPFTEDDLSVRECWCLDCNARVTVAVKRNGEYGHYKYCEHYMYESDAEQPADRKLGQQEVDDYV